MRIASFDLRPIAAALLFVVAAGPALADEFSGGDVFNDTDFAQANPNENFVLRGSFGAASIEALEHVYAGSSGDENLSLLVWQSTAPIASLDAKARFPGGWTLRGHFDAAVSGDSTMTDYDWFGPYFAGYDPNNWTHRSISPNTSLDWYLNAEIAVGRDLPISKELTINVNGGVKYTDVQWTAVGGSYIYSVSGFRDSVGLIPDVPAVSYRQQLPTVFAGIDANIDDGPWSLEAGGKLGMVVYGNSVDHHFLNAATPPKYIIDQLQFGSVYSATAKLGYNFSPNLGVFVEGSYEKMNTAHTPSDYYLISNNLLFLHGDTIGGAELQTASLKGGLKGSF